MESKYRTILAFTLLLVIGVALNILLQYAAKASRAKDKTFIVAEVVEGPAPVQQTEEPAEAIDAEESQKVGEAFEVDVESVNESLVALETPELVVETEARQAYQRIVCMSPAVTELVYALGAGEQVAGVASFSVYPAEVAEKTDVGGWINPNYERLLGLNADLVVVQGVATKVADFCEQHEIALEYLAVENVAEILASIEKLGELLGRETEAVALADSIRAEFEAVRQRVGELEKKKVFLAMGHLLGSLGQLGTVGGNTFLNDLLEIAGGENIFADVTEQTYPQISKESLLKRQPEIIIELHPGQELSQEEQDKLTHDYQVMAQLPAVQNEKLYFLTEDYLLIPGPRIGKIAVRFAEIIHPVK